MNFTPTPLTAAIAGAFSAIALPLLHAWMGEQSGLSMMVIVAMVVTVALPAQALVVGPKTDQGSGSRSLDTAFLKRIGAWLLAAAAVTGIRLML